MKRRKFRAGILILILGLLFFLFAEKRCPQCRKVYPDEKKYCIHCGVKLVPVEKKPKEKPTIKVNIEVSGDSVLITSTPEGSAVYLDGEYKANTPLKLRDIPAGSHTIKLTYPGYKEFTRTVTISADTIIIKECPKCKGWFGLDILYCPYCEEDSDPVMLKPLTISKGSVGRCPKCRLYFPDSFNFCPFCGEEDKPVQLIRVR